MLHLLRLQNKIHRAHSMGCMETRSLQLHDNVCFYLQLQTFNSLLHVVLQCLPQQAEPCRAVSHRWRLVIRTFPSSLCWYDKAAHLPQSKHLIP